MPTSYPPPTIGPLDLLDATITQSITGAWVATCSARADGTATLPATPVTITIEGQSWTGAAAGVAANGRWDGTVTGGFGRLTQEIGPRSYQGCSVSYLLGELFRLAGGNPVETLDTSVAADILSTQLDSWQLIQGPLKEALGALTRKYGWSWRVLRSGRVWLGAESWIDGRTLAPQAIELDSDWSDGSVELTDAQQLDPGITWSGHRINEVVHQLTGGQSLRTILRERLTSDALTGSAERIRRELLLGCMWGASVLRQHSDGTCAVQLDDARLAGSGIDRVPIVVGIPGVQITVAAGARVIVTWLGGDPGLPRIVGFDERRGLGGQDRLTSVTLKASAGVTVDAAAVSLGTASTQPIPRGTDLKTWLDTHVHPTGMGPSGAPAVALPGTVLSSVSSTA